jgi:hypothetical protein
MDWLLMRGAITRTEYDTLRAQLTSGNLSEASRGVAMLGFNADIASFNNYTYNWDLVVWSETTFIGRVHAIAVTHALATRISAAHYYAGIDSFKLMSSGWLLSGDGATVEPDEFTLVPTADLARLARDYVGNVTVMPDYSQFTWPTF